jgi:hypothetical protein
MGVPVCNDDDDDDDVSPLFQLLHHLPVEVLDRILHMFCDGKSLSTFSLALAASTKESYQKIAWTNVPLVCLNKLLEIALTIQDKSAQNEDVSEILGAVQWVRSIASALDPTEQEEDASFSSRAASQSSRLPPRNRMRILSENAAVLDYLLDSLKYFSDLEKGHFSWMVWCGSLTIDSFLTGSRMRNSGRVLISSPMQRPSLIPGWNLLRNHSPTQIFRCEPYNIVPIPPWGRIHGLGCEDNRILRPVADRLAETNQVAIPMGSYGSGDLDIRILTAAQARLLSARYRVRTGWMLQDVDDAPLLCCWQDESNELENDRDYIDYVIDLLRVRDRLRTYTEPSARPRGLSGS